MKLETRLRVESRVALFPVCPTRAPLRAAFIVGITGDGYIPVVEKEVGSTGVSVVGLPAMRVEAQWNADQVLRRLATGLRREFGYEAAELVPMESRSDEEGLSPSLFLLAPLLATAGWRPSKTVPPSGVYEVALPAVPEWLRQRELAGALESPSLREGLRRAAERFPAWARGRLGRALGELKDRARNSQ
jgi:hypothetical protein